LGKLELLPYECTVCKKTFLSYFELNYDEKYFEEHLDEKGRVRFEFKDIDYIHPIKNERKCRRCRKGLQLDMFFDADIR